MKIAVDLAQPDLANVKTGVVSAAAMDRDQVVTQRVGAGNISRETIEGVMGPNRGALAICHMFVTERAGAPRVQYGAAMLAVGPSIVDADGLPYP